LGSPPVRQIGATSAINQSGDPKAKISLSFLSFDRAIRHSPTAAQVGRCNPPRFALHLMAPIAGTFPPTPTRPPPNARRGDSSRTTEGRRPASRCTCITLLERAKA